MTEEQRDRYNHLSNICTTSQGYYLHDPEEEKEYMELILVHDPENFIHHMQKWIATSRINPECIEHAKAMVLKQRLKA